MRKGLQSSKAAALAIKQARGLQRCLQATTSKVGALDREHDVDIKATMLPIPRLGVRMPIELGVRTLRPRAYDQPYSLAVAPLKPRARINQ